MTKQRKGDFIDEESGTIFIEVVKQEVAEAMEGVRAKMDEFSETQQDERKRVDEELAFIKDKLAGVGAMARAAAIASAVPIKPEGGWEPLAIERYPKKWVEEHGVVDVAITPDYDHPSIMMSGLTIPVKPGVVFQVPGNVAEMMANLGLLGMPKEG